FYGRTLPYEKEIDRRLEPLASHPVVERWSEMERSGLNYVTAYQWMLTLGAPPELAPGPPAAGDILRAAGGVEGLEEFRLMLADFARAADFEALYAQTARLRDPMVADYLGQSRRLGMRRDLERYWGGPMNLRYTLVVSPFLESAVAVTALTRDPDGTPRLTSLSGVEISSGEAHPFLTRRRGTMWAEAVNEALTSVSAANEARLKTSRSLLPAGPGRCAPTWEECSRREAAFAVAARLLARAGDKTSADELPVKYARVGMPHIGALIARLDQFEKNRARWPTLPDFYPRLLDVYDSLAAAGPSTAPFAGGIAAALADPAPCVLIAPDSASPELNAALLRFRREHRLCDEELSGEAALKRDLTGRGLIVVGTASQNAWLNANWGALQLPARFDGPKLLMNPRPDEYAGTAYAGRIGFVSSARNPADAGRPVLLFSAAAPDLLPALLDDFSGATDYEIRDGRALVKNGVYEKSRIPWRTK
ncbi:MAG: hypothetical protein KGL74_13765, partial [Elusimicrobia bacterium]|nr:hypothetical protein [Elusimicrobiota bacterium]